MTQPLVLAGQHIELADRLLLGRIQDQARRLVGLAVHPAEQSCERLVPHARISVPEEWERRRDDSKPFG